MAGEAVAAALSDVRARLRRAGLVVRRPPSLGAPRGVWRPARRWRGPAAVHDLPRAIDHTLLAPTATVDDVRALCEQAVTHGFAAVCVSPQHVAAARVALDGRGPALATVAGFPHGCHAAEIKAHEAAHAVRDGALEVDVVAAHGLLLEGAPKRGAWRAAPLAAYQAELVQVRRALRRAGGRRPVVLKVILETGLLDRRQVLAAACLAAGAGADFVKTSTGFVAGGATRAHVSLLRAAVGARVGVKASGGVRDRATALALLRAGADRLGSSSGVALVGG